MIHLQFQRIRNVDDTITNNDAHQANNSNQGGNAKRIACDFNAQRSTEYAKWHRNHNQQGNFDAPELVQQDDKDDSDSDRHGRIERRHFLNARFVITTVTYGNAFW